MEISVGNFHRRISIRCPARSLCIDSTKIRVGFYCSQKPRRLAAPCVAFCASIECKNDTGQFCGDMYSCQTTNTAQQNTVVQANEEMLTLHTAGKIVASERGQYSYQPRTRRRKREPASASSLSSSNKCCLPTFRPWTPTRRTKCEEVVYCHRLST
ncbi:unnamed protein product [Amoebophrya sp. A120]|nr:unnamed protein product [Amoebophrya sp. A120]|eukprot:GSA120T00006686001.1